MALSHTPCVFHPDKVAVTICERCRAPVCLEDKRVFQQARSRGTGHHTHRYYIRKELCPHCYVTTLQKAASFSIFDVFFIGFLAFFGLASLAMFPPFILFAGLILFLYLRSKTKYGKQAEYEAQKLRTLKTPSSLTSKIEWESRPSPQANNLPIHCFQCGSQIEWKNRYCPECGDPTQEEKEAFR